MKKETLPYEARHQNAEAEPSVSPLFAVCMCVCSYGLFSCSTQLRLLKRAKCVCYSDHFEFSVLSVSQGSEDLEKVRLGIYYMVSGAVQKQLPKISLKEKERILHGGARSVDMETCKHLP